MPTRWPRLGPWLAAAAVLFWCAPDCFSACCYFSAKDKDMLQMRFELQDAEGTVVYDDKVKIGIKPCA